MKETRRPRVRLLGVFLALMAVSTGAEAQAASSNEGWHFQLTPYFWASGVQGSVTIRRLPALEVDASFSDIIDKLDFGFLGRFEGRKGRFGFATDLVYLNLGAPLGEGHPVILILEPEIDVRQIIAEGVGFYRLAQDPDDAERAYADVFVGARYFKARNRINLVGGTVAESSVAWADAILGLRGRAPLGSKAAFLARGDIGTFGSNFAYNIEGSLVFSISKRWSLGAGYRYLHEDYETGSGTERSALDIGFGGPLLQATFAF